MITLEAVRARIEIEKGKNLQVMNVVFLSRPWYIHNCRQSPCKSGVATKLPRKLCRQTGHGVEQGPRDDHVVVDHHQERDDQHPVTETFACWGHPKKKFG